MREPQVCVRLERSEPRLAHVRASERCNDASWVSDQKHERQIDATDALELPRAERVVGSVDDIPDAGPMGYSAVQLLGDSPIGRAHPPASHPPSGSKQRGRALQTAPR